MLQGSRILRRTYLKTGDQDIAMACEERVTQSHLVRPKNNFRKPSIFSEKDVGSLKDVKSC